MKRILFLLFALVVMLASCSPSSTLPKREPSAAYLRMKAAIDEAYAVPAETIVDHLAGLGITCEVMSNDDVEYNDSFCTLLEGDSSKNRYLDDYAFMFREDHKVYTAKGQLVVASERRRVREAFVWIVSRPECSMAIFSPYDSDRWICFGDPKTIDHYNITYEDKDEYVAVLTELFAG